MWARARVVTWLCGACVSWTTVLRGVSCCMRVLCSVACACVRACVLLRRVAVTVTAVLLPRDVEAVVFMVCCGANVLPTMCVWCWVWCKYESVVRGVYVDVWRVRVV